MKEHIKKLYRFLQIKKLYKSLENFLSINWIKTIYFNFKMLPYEKAKKLPVIFYGKVQFTSLKGKITINLPISKGLCKFGYNMEISRAQIGIAEIRIDGELIINGSFIVSNDYNIHVLRGARFEIGQGSYFGIKTRIVVTNRISVGKFLRLGYESQLIDSNFHHTIDIKSGIVQSIKHGEIVISDYCWVGNRTTIMKGTITPRYLIIGSNSLLNKNYKKEIPEKSIIGGIPAKLIKENVVRIFDHKKESMLHKYFAENPNASSLKVSNIKSLLEDD